MQYITDAVNWTVSWVWTSPETKRVAKLEKLRRQKHDVNVDLKTSSFVVQFFTELGQVAVKRRAKLDQWEQEHLPEQQKKHEEKVAEQKRLLKLVEDRESSRKSQPDSISGKMTSSLPIEILPKLQEIRAVVKPE